jgi:DNA repair exonuclease SbcCD nuclease subunit
VKLLHTADLQLGMPFLRVPGDRGAKLRELRLEAITRIGDLAQSERVDVVVVAGDLFDANTIDDRVVVQAMTRFADITLPVVVIPGNHDHCSGPSSVYHRASFRDARPSNVTVLETRDPHVMLDGRALVLPAPLLQRHEVADTTAHITRDLGRDLAPDAIRIGLAHGDVIGFKRDDEGDSTNFIEPARATIADLDYLALGDWHGMKRIGDRTWYSGAPEPTGFKQNDPGYALVVEIAAHGAPAIVTPHRVARTRWVVHEAELHADADVAALEAWLRALEAPLDSVVKLDVRGALSLADGERLDAILARAEAQLLYLQHTGARVVPLASDEELASIARDGYVKDAVDRLREIAQGGGDAARRAALALQMLHRMHREAGA